MNIYTVFFLLFLLNCSFSIRITSFKARNTNLSYTTEKVNVNISKQDDFMKPLPKKGSMLGRNNFYIEIKS